MRRHRERRNGSTRRTFLKGALCAPVAVSAAAVLRGGTAPSDRITLGFIGVGSMGLRHIKGFLEEESCLISAICDVDAKRMQAATSEVDKAYGKPGCKQYRDFRELMADDSVDALVISVPDHWHAAISLAGIRAGKDIYGEKPLALTIDEGKEMVREVERYGCVWQTGTWQRSTRHFRLACELVRNGRIGKLQRVEVGIGLGHRIDPQPPMPVPPWFDYEMWLGPAPYEPYTEKRCHWNFRWILDYSGGQVTDWGAHHIDIAQWGMGTDETGPIEVEGKGEFPQYGLFDTAVSYHFTCRYANGVILEVASRDRIPQGVKWYGTDGWVHVTRRGLKIGIPGLTLEEVTKPDFDPGPVRLPRPPGDHRQGHRKDFLRCIARRTQPISSIQVSHRSVTIAHLGNIAMLTGRKIRWDPARETIVGDPGAERMQRRPMRAPWHL